jgi:hypothetical protein
MKPNNTLSNTNTLIIKPVENNKYDAILDS